MQTNISLNYIMMMDQAVQTFSRFTLTGGVEEMQAIAASLNGINNSRPSRGTVVSKQLLNPNAQWSNAKGS